MTCKKEDEKKLGWTSLLSTEEPVHDLSIRAEDIAGDEIETVEYNI